MNARNIVLFAALFALFWSASLGFAGVDVCRWISPSCGFPYCCEGSYGVELSNDTNNPIDVVIYGDFYQCLSSPCCDPCSGSPYWYGCAHVTVPANRSCANNPYGVVLTAPAHSDLCACGPYGISGGLHTLRVEIFTSCDMTRGACTDVDGNCGTVFTWGGAPVCCPGPSYQHCFHLDNRVSGCCP